MGIKKKNRMKAGCFLLICALLLAGCGKAAPDQKKKEREPVKTEQAKTETPSDSSIPEELLPSQDETNESGSQGNTGEKNASGTGNAEQGSKKQDETKQGSTKSSAKSSSGSQNAVSGSSKPDAGKQEPEKQTIQVKISVECKNAAKEGYTGPTTLLSAKTLTLKKGATVYDALEAAGVSFSGSGGYVAGIGGVYEFDWGNGSGWMYFVNGVKPGVGCDNYICKDGDVIAWRYTTNMGKDL